MFSFRQFLIENEEKAKKTIRWLGDHINKTDSTAYSIRNLDSEDHSFSYHVKTHPDFAQDIIDDNGHHGHTMAKLIADRMDPSPDKKYSQWAYQGWLQGTHQFEDHPRVKEALEKFHANKRILGNTIPEDQIHNGNKPKKGSDINAYADIHHLESHMDKVLNPHKVENTGDFSHPDAPLIHNQDGLKVHSLDSQKASEHTRKCFDNKWCTARNDDGNMYDEYTHGFPNDRGQPASLYHVHTPDGKHWQFHFESESFADHNDIMYNPETLVHQYPELKKVKAFHQYGLQSLPFAENDDDRDKIISHHIENEDVSPHSIQTIHTHMKPHHYDSLIDSKPNVDVITALFKTRSLSELQTHKLLDQLDHKNYIHSSGYEAALIKSPHSKSVADRLITNPNRYVRKAVAEHGDMEHLDKLVDDKEPIVRQQVANRGYYAHLDKLVDDPEKSVRKMVAILGNKSHHDKLVHDPNSDVRNVVALHSENPDHLGILVKDEDHGVQRNAIYKTDDLDHLRAAYDNPASPGNKELAKVRHNLIVDQLRMPHDKKRYIVT